MWAQVFDRQLSFFLQNSQSETEAQLSRLVAKTLIKKCAMAAAGHHQCSIP
jgi:hypothetical protein